MKWSQLWLRQAIFRILKTYLTLFRFLGAFQDPPQTGVRDRASAWRYRGRPVRSIILSIFHSSQKIHSRTFSNEFLALSPGLHLLYLRLSFIVEVGVDPFSIAFSCVSRVVDLCFLINGFADRRFNYVLT